MQLHPQALGYDFTIVSASEKNPEFRSFFLDNIGECAFQHVFDSVEDQLAPTKPCLLCAKANRRCQEVSDCGSNRVHLLVTGSPCDPFSIQRCKRFSEGNIKSHCLYAVTMEMVIGMYKKYSPALGIMEQVMGFLMPVQKNAAETPYDRPAGSHVGIRFWFHWASFPMAHAS